MNTYKKLCISLAWIGLYLTMWLMLFELRKIGTAWINTAGGIRVIILALLGCGTLIPLTLSILVWRGTPKRLYKQGR